MKTQNRYSSTGKLVFFGDTFIATAINEQNAAFIAESMNLRIKFYQREMIHKAKIALNKFLEPIYFPLVPIPQIAELLTSISDFDTSILVDWPVHDSANRLNCPIGFDVYLTLTWYRMPSGNFEIVGYIS